MRQRHIAIVLAGGSGSRMGSSIPKQYMEIEGKPILFYTLLAFEKSFIDEIILVVRAGDEEYCRQKFLEEYKFRKIVAVTAGGSERYLSVAAGLHCYIDSVCCCADTSDYSDVIWVHDGARPFLDQSLLERLREEQKVKGAVVPGVRVKDTIKQAAPDGRIMVTPPREQLWNIQTPQVFCAELLTEAYRRLLEKRPKGITDDSMVVEQMMECPVYIVEGSYNNIKITTPEDLYLGEWIMKSQNQIHS